MISYTKATPDEIPAEIAGRAFAGMSHSPEKRGASAREEYAGTFNSWADSVSKREPQDGTAADLAAFINEARARFRQKYIAYLSANASCMSPMITGPARFPVASNQKKMDSAQRRWEEADEVLKKAGRIIQRRFFPLDSGISSDRDDAADLLRQKLAGLEVAQECMKQANKVIRKHKGQPTPEAIAELKSLGLDDARAAGVFKPDFCGRIGFADYELSNNNANIRRIKARIAEIEAKASHTTTETERAGVTVVDNVEDNRLQLFFPGKPSDEIRTELKSRGFRWSPRNGCWQRMRSNSAQHAANCVLEKVAS